MTQTLTRSQVLEMEPGNKLNAWIAWKVMGYGATTTSFNPNYGELYIRNLVENVGSGNIPNGVERVEFAYMELLPDFSDDIAEAWKVEEWFAETGIRGRYAKRLKEVILANKGECSTFDMVHASPADRCKAALLAVLDL